MRSDKRRSVFLSVSLNKESGFTLIELMVTMLVFGLVMATVSSEFFLSTRRSYDQKTIAKAQEYARTLLDAIAFDIRMAGAGVPIGQTNFSFVHPLVGEAALPIALNAENDVLSIRFNQRGVSTVLVKDYTPSGASLTFEVVNSVDFEEQDEICISDITAGGGDGLCGTIEGVSGNEITIASSYSANAGIVLEAGSEVHRISTVTYEALPLNGGITRTWDDSSVMMAPDSSFSLVYQSADGDILTPPLTDLQVANELAGIVLTVNVTGERDLITGEDYTATLQQSIALRNAILNR